jgi:hypothetical protein
VFFVISNQRTVRVLTLNKFVNDASKTLSHPDILGHQLLQLAALVNVHEYAYLTPVV